MKKFLIIGYGNTLRGDDGLGPYIVENLPNITGNLGKNIRIISLPQLDVSLSLLLCKTDVVIFVDARTDDIDELVSIEKVRRQKEPITLNYISHTISIPTLLRISLDWYRAEPLCYVVMAKGFDFSFGEKISEKALKSANLAQEKIMEILQSND